ncbi:MAG: molybdopterin synthase sulfur carrier subunit [Gammaproteobacteria bacterium]|nr:MAG: molybdopterin synthase sulfur carrier subunit [Gammaproteobacteria bacterium]
MSDSTEQQLERYFTLLYFAFLQEASGKFKEQRRWTENLTTRQLFEQVIRELSLSVSQDNFRVSINHEFVDWDQIIAVDDIVAFIPPVAGG